MDRKFWEIWKPSIRNDVTFDADTAEAELAPSKAKFDPSIKPGKSVMQQHLESPPEWKRELPLDLSTPCPLTLRQGGRHGDKQFQR